MTDHVTDPGAADARTDADGDPSPASGDSAPPEYDVRSDLPVFTCDRCGAPFAREGWLALHRGLEHTETLADEEVEAFREAHADEEAELRKFRLKMLGALIALYFGLLMVYALV